MSAQCDRPDCTATRAALDDERARRTTGGTPKPCADGWANLVSTPPPDTATDPNAPAHRRVGMRASNDGGVNR